MDDLSGSSFEVSWSMYCGRLTGYGRVGIEEVVDRVECGTGFR
jgi:hypothetical protein